MKIIDCFTFYNETDLLDYRINILKNIVDTFILVESTHTHVGLPKSINFNPGNYRNVNIVHVIVNDFPFCNADVSKNEQWSNEKFQRNCIKRGLDQLNLQSF